MIIGITLDEVVRDFIGKLIVTYNKQLNEEINPIIETLNLEEYFPMKDSGIEFNRFLYEESGIDVFGYSKESYLNAMSHLNMLCGEYSNKHEFLIINKEYSNAISGTLFFLSKTGCKLPNYKFVSSDQEIWDNVDLLVTANPNLIKNKPNNKKVIKVSSTYNSNSESDYTVQKIKEILDLKILDSIENTKIVTYEDME